MPLSLNDYVKTPNGKAKIRSLQAVFFDFDGVFTDNNVLVSEDGKEYVKCSRFDGIGLSKLKSLNMKLHIISSEPNSVVTQRAKKMGIEVSHGAHCKVKTAEELLNLWGLKFEQCAFIGNDINDLALMEKVALTITVPDAWPTVLSSAMVVTNLMGGKGAVREVCEVIYEEKADD